MKTVIFTALALLAFAGNSVLCRLALGENTIDAASFTWVRLLSGVIVLALILKIRQAQSITVSKSHTISNNNKVSKGSWNAALMLFLYAICFSFAYISLDTGMGALILFAAVQITIIAVGVISGNRLYAIEWLGAMVAFIGFALLVLPGSSQPPLGGFVLMSVAGIAWGFYTIAGKRSTQPLPDTAYNFIRTLPFALALLVLTIHESYMSTEGILLAVISGGVTSGIGYAIWYVALGGLSNVQAAVLQLLVPVIAALGGVLFADEVLSLRLILSSILILGGILAVIVGKKVMTERVKV